MDDDDIKEMVEAAIDVLTDPDNRGNSLYREMAVRLIIVAAEIRGYVRTCGPAPEPICNAAG